MCFVAFGRWILSTLRIFHGWLQCSSMIVGHFPWNIFEQLSKKNVQETFDFNLKLDGLTVPTFPL